MKTWRGSPAALLGHSLSEADMGIKSLLSKWLPRKRTTPPPPNGPAKPSV